MTSAVDSSILFDVLLADPQFAESSEQALRACFREGPVVVCPVVYAELAAAMPGNDADQFLSDLHITVDQLEVEALRTAGSAWARITRDVAQMYSAPPAVSDSQLACPQCKAAIAWRQHAIPDFLIGAHAEAKGHRLLTRDPRRYRAYFPTIDVIAPDTHP